MLTYQATCRRSRGTIHLRTHVQLLGQQGSRITDDTGRQVSYVSTAPLGTGPVEATRVHEFRGCHASAAASVRHKLLADGMLRQSVPT
jgi:hypothetical protein